MNLHTIKAKGWEKYEDKVESHYVKNITMDRILETISVLQNEIELMKKYVV